MKLPYGLADFTALIREGYVYLDRTRHLADLEDLGRSLLFVRPRRFGKSLWLRTLAAYYDLATADQHQALFGNLVAGREPTPLAHRFFVLIWNFSEIEPRGSAEAVSERLNSYLNTLFRIFLDNYRDHLPAIDLEPNATDTFRRILDAIRRTPYRLYLLIDEYDNFANELVVADEPGYQDLVRTDGPFKALMKSVKSATEGQGLDRLFVTGVSPVVMSDLSSGMNMLRDVYLEPALASLCGFRESEIEDLLQRIHTAQIAPTWSIDEALDVVRTWYNGYRFALDSDEQVYNPTMSLYFLDHLARHGAYPRQLLDANLATDEDKLRHLGELATGRQTLLDIVQHDRSIEIPELASRFRLGELSDETRPDRLVSFLYYFGMLTLEGTTDYLSLRLSVPNLVARKLYLDRIRDLLLPAPIDGSAADDAVRRLQRDGDIEPLLSFVETKIFPVLSNRDYRFVNELAVKTILLTLLFNDLAYQVASEPELHRGYADLLLLRRPDSRDTGLFDLLFEIKYLKLSDLGQTGEQLRGNTDVDILPRVHEALDDAEAQARRYAGTLIERSSDLKLRVFAVVALGFERLVARQVEV